MKLFLIMLCFFCNGISSYGQVYTRVFQTDSINDIRLEGTIKAKRNISEKKFIIEVFGSNGMSLGSQPDSLNHFIFYIKPETKYKLVFSKKGKNIQTIEFTTDGFKNGSKIIFNLILDS